MPKLLKTNTATIQIPEKVLSGKGREIKSTTSKGNISRKSVLIETGGDKVKVIKEGDYAEPPEKKKRTYKKKEPVVKKPDDTKKKNEAATKIAGAYKAKKARKEMAEKKKNAAAKKEMAMIEEDDEDKKYPSEMYKGIKLIYKGKEIPSNKLQKMSKKKQKELLKEEWQYDDDNGVYIIAIGQDMMENIWNYGNIENKVNQYLERGYEDKAYNLMEKEQENILTDFRAEGRKQFIDELIENKYTSYEEGGVIIKMKKYTFLY